VISPPLQSTRSTALQKEGAEIHEMGDRSIPVSGKLPTVSRGGHSSVGDDNKRSRIMVGDSYLMSVKQDNCSDV
jgi:hypothetical protein